MSSKYSYSIIQVGTQTDLFLETERITNPFISSVFINTLEEFGYKSLSFFIFEKQEKKAFVHIPLDNSDYLHDLVVYSGITFAHPQANQNYFQSSSERHQISEYVAELVCDLAPNSQFNLHPSVIDIRAWQWFDYDNKLNSKYKVTPRYTSIIKMDNSCDDVFTLLSPSMGSSRRQEYRKSLKSNHIFQETMQTSNLIDAYLDTMTRQNQYRSALFIKCLQKLLINLLKAKLAKSYEIITNDGLFLSSSYWITAHDYSVYFWGATSSANKSSSAGTRVLIDSIRYLSNQSSAYFDLEGINSPQRGWFKLSLGGNITPYFSIQHYNAG